MSNITTTYRQEVANFLFTCDQKLSSSGRSLTSWIGDTARSVTLRSVAAAAAGDVPSSLGANGIGIKTSVPNRADDFLCMTCGTFLLPQAKSNQNHTASSLTELATNPTGATTTHCKISLQSMKRGRSRRRRSSRCRAKELHNSSLLMKRAGSTNNPRINVMAQKELLKVADSYRLGDGKSKQCIVVECKFCGSKRKRKGIEVSVKNTRRKTESDAKPSCSKSKNEKKTQTHAQSESKMNTIGTQIRDNTDFISLASFGKSKQQATKKRPMKNDTPLLQVGKKKKKKQEPKGKKSSLMDFLSSLND